MSYNTGATFYPGGDDSYYLPEIVQPAPHRIAELPTNIQQNVAQMEKQVQSPGAHLPQSVMGSRNEQPQFSPLGDMGNPFNQHQHHANNITQSYQNSPPINNPIQSYQKPEAPRVPSAGLPEAPNFSPFPILRNPPPNIPPTDEQKEATLEAARDAVLSSNDPETQLMWAQDALAHVEAAEQNEIRISATQPPRPRTPRIEHLLKEDAMKVVNFLADQHHPKAEFMRGMWLEFGKLGHRVDKKEAFHCYTRASEKGYARAHYRIGMQFESSNDALKAIKYYQRGAEANDSASCYRLGMMTLLGQHGQVQDFERALSLIHQSAETADENAPQGAYVLGMLQAQELPQITVPDRYLPKDLASAKINIEKAAYLGFAKAQVKMGSAYELCELGCPFDPALSLHYSALAARQGEPEAEMAISKWFLVGHEGVFEKSEEMAFTYAQRAAVGGFHTAQFAMGYFYEVGIYVPSDFAIAKEWYRKASQGGNSDAGGRIDAISRSKTLSRKDHESIALSKIRQQQARPQVPTVPTVQEESETIDMPDPSRLSITSPPPRATSTTPYPTGPANMPLANAPPEIRPASAFGINPNLRSHSAAPMPGPRRESYGNPAYPPDQRPYNGLAPYGRGGRTSSGTPLGYPPMQQGRPQPRPGSTTPYLNPHAPQNGPPQGHVNPPQGHPQGPPQGPPQPAPVKLDIGYTAPPDATADRRPRYPTNGQQGGKPSATPGQGGNPPRGSSRPGLPSQSSAPTGGKPSGPQAQNERPPTAGPGKPPAKAQTQPAPQQPVQSKNKTKPNTVAPAAAKPRPDGKGPKTFDEMGVPAAKEKGDCRVM